ncbi:hypothetical protein CYY_006362 [Polysphondylium violaceum]|uniref:Uncharacterized protein n=1 Tax=Polysphondylium violaceum TaxID=133409 RepID=A0A8J4UZ15_9MYCE|nr:hypothetical protein CYY_006362 [Polysphondylium violaceum]
MNNSNASFFSIWRNTPLKRSILLSIPTSIIIKHIGKLDKDYHYLQLLREKNIPIVYAIDNLLIYSLYDKHPLKHLISHVILSISIYLNHLSLFVNQPTPPQIYGLAMEYLGYQTIKLPTSIKFVQIKTMYIPFLVDLLYAGVETLYLNESDYPLTMNALPHSLTKLVLRFSPPLKNFNLNVIPSSVTNLSLEHLKHDNIIDFGHLPNLVYLRLYHCLGQLDFTKGLQKLKYLRTSGVLNSTNLYIPKSVTYLDTKLHNHFTSSDLPPNLVHLKVHYFQKSTKRQSTTLENNIFPNTLKSLIIKGDGYTNFYSDSIPNQLAKFTNVNTSKKEYANVPIPPNCTDLSFSISHLYLTTQLPTIHQHIRKLKIVNPISSIPPDYFYNGSLSKLTFEYYQPISPNLIPNTVTNLSIKFNHPIEKDVIPTSVTKLSLDHDSTSISPIIIPSNVQSLSFTSSKYLTKQLDLPKSVLKLKFQQLDTTSFQEFIHQDNIKHVNTLVFIKDLIDFQNSLEMQSTRYNPLKFPSTKRIKKTIKFPRDSIIYYFENNQCTFENIFSHCHPPVK